MLNPSKPPLPPNKPYHWPLNNFEYVKDFDPNVHVIFLKIAIRANSETNDVKIINMFSFTLSFFLYDWCNNYMGDYPNFTFVELQLVFCKRYKRV
jgi:hypothetical protein